MRIARRQPIPYAPLPIRALAVAGGTLTIVLAIVTAFAPRHASVVSREGAAPGARITMADAFGLGGLSGLSDGGEAVAPSPVESRQIVTYYGNPYTPSMGILGEHDPEAAADMLEEAANRFRFVSGARVLPALHVVYGVAQPQPGSDARSLQYLDDRTVRQFIDLARRRGFIVILDLQIGHSQALAEVQRIATYLREPDVFVALDPEFALPAGTKPGEAVGSIDASDINNVQAYLARLSTEQRIPNKLLIVHQFDTGMIRNASSIERRSDVDLVIDMDGYGSADIKAVKYRRTATSSYAPYSGIKIFLHHDTDPLSELQIQSLDPRPSLVVYQ